MTVQRLIQLGAEQVSYSLSRSAKRRTLGIAVQPDGSLVVTAPVDADENAVETRLRKRAPWILEARRDFERMRPRTPERCYVPGETHRFLGRQYRLTVDATGPLGVILDHDRLVVGGLDATEAARVRNRLAIWYQAQARQIFALRHAHCVGKLGLKERAPRLLVRPLEKRWGSLSPTGRSLLLNRRLVEAELPAIDFVIIHELCHLDYRDHGPEFLELLDSRLPDWRIRKARLEKWML
jgi:predicted metal-dependent hydrolase